MGKRKTAADQQLVPVIIDPRTAVDVVERHGVRIERGGEPVLVPHDVALELVNDRDSHGVPLCRVAEEPADTPADAPASSAEADTPAEQE